MKVITAKMCVRLRVRIMPGKAISHIMPAKAIRHIMPAKATNLIGMKTL